MLFIMLTAATAALVTFALLTFAPRGGAGDSDNSPRPRSPIRHYALFAFTAAALAAGLLGGAAAMAQRFVDFPPALLYIAFALCGAAAAWRGVTLARAGYRARRGFEALLLALFALMAATAVFVTIGLIASVLGEATAFFRLISPIEFLFSAKWSPQIAIREDQVGAAGAFGFIPLLAGTLLISVIAMTVATPIGLFAAVYMSEFADKRVRQTVKPVLEILAGIPTIVYGFFAVVFLSPILVRLGMSLGVEVASENALAAGLVLGMMLIPFIASLSEDAFHAVPDSLRQGAYGLGATRYETAMQVVFPAALPGLAGGFLLSFSRAVGETMIVVMAAGVSAHMTANPLEAVTTITVQIVTLLTGDQSFDDPKTLAAFALGLALFTITLAFNLIALIMVRRYREHYE